MSRSIPIYASPAVYEAAMLLIKEAVEFLNQQGIHEKYLLFLKKDAKEFLSEYATVRVGSHRGAGHTTAMLQIAAGQLTNPQSRICLIFPSMDFQRQAMSKLKRMMARTQNCVAMTIHSMDAQMRGQGPFDLVMIDDCGHSHKDTLEQVYEMLEPTLVCDQIPLIVSFH